MEHNIGKTIAALRKEKGWTQGELAKRLTVSDKAVSKWEISEGLPSLEFIPVLADIFGVTTDYLLTGVKQEPQKTYSDLELCVKSGNIRRALKLYGERDENGKSVLDYAIEYKNVDMVTMMLSPDGYLISSRKNGGKRTAVVVDDIGRVEKLVFIKELLGEYSLAEYYRAVLRLLPLNLERELARMAYMYSNYNTNYSSYSYNSRRRGFVFKQELRDNGAADSDTNASAQSEIKKICDYLIKNYEELPEEQKKYYFGKTNPDTKRFECWSDAYLIFIACAYEQGKPELLKQLVKKYIDKVYPSGYKFDLTPLLKPLMQSYEDDKDAFKFIYALFEEKKGSWENGKEFLDFVLKVYKTDGRAEGDKLNKIAGNYYSEDEIRCLYIEQDKSKTKAQKLEEKCVYKGLLWLDKAVESGDIAFIKKAFKKYPLTLTELLEEDLKSRNFEKLFKFAVDNVPEGYEGEFGYGALAKEIIKAARFADTAEIPAVVEKYGQIAVKRQLAYNDIAVFNAIPNGEAEENGGCDEVLNKLLKANYKSLTGYKCKPGFKFNVNSYYREPSLDMAFELLKKETETAKAVVLKKLEAEKEKKTETGEKRKSGKTDGLTKKYFEDLLEKGDSEKVVTKLCVKLEGYFRNNGYEGDLFEMLNGYCDKIGQHSEKAKILHRLRMARNSEVHPEKSVTLSVDELKICIKTVFEITEGK